jgi:hypothetical protein
VRLRRVPKLDDERVTFERLLYETALDTFAATVNQPHFTKARLVSSVHVLFDH